MSRRNPATPSAPDSELTPERLFSDPPLMPTLPVAPRFAPDGTFVTYLKRAQDDSSRTDLWRIDLPAGRTSDDTADNLGEGALWIDARGLANTSSDVTRMTAAERAERERKRNFSHGITQYEWFPDGEHLLIPIDGTALRLNIHDMTTTALCPSGTRQTAFSLAGNSQRLAYVREGNLYFTALDTLTEKQVTHDASETVTNGLPDFLAAEEMHRHEGFWWSWDANQLVYCKVDESKVDISYRMEIDAEGARTLPQRYPFPGTTNPWVELWLYDVPTDTHTQIWANTTQEAYLARVSWQQDQLYIQTQDRRQQHLHLQRYNPNGQEWEPVWSEHSETWVNLNDDFRRLPNDRLLVSHEQNGPRQIALLSTQSFASPPTPTEISAPHHIVEVLGQRDGLVYVSGWDTTPLDLHLFEISLSSGEATQITQEPGIHAVQLDASAEHYLEVFNSDKQIPVLRWGKLNPDTRPVSLTANALPENAPYKVLLDKHSWPEFGTLTARDGAELWYRLTRPINFDASLQYPVIVYVYGGPGGQKVVRNWGSGLLQLFAHHGFAVMEVDNRGTSNRGRTFDAPLYGNMGFPEVQDQVTGVEFLHSLPWVDTDRIGVFGHSYGGYLTLMCLCQAGDQFAAGVAVAPVCDWQMYDSHYTERFMGLPTENEDGYRNSNVLTHLHKLDRPLLLMHGMADDNVLFSHSTLIIAELQKQLKPFDLMTYPGAKHSMQERHVSIHRFNKLLEFFKQKL